MIRLLLQNQSNLIMLYIAFEKFGNLIDFSLNRITAFRESVSDLNND